MWCLTGIESLEVLAADSVSRSAGREEATSIRIERSMVTAMCGVQFKDRKKIYRFDVHVGSELKYRSSGYGKLCSLVWSCDEERGWQCFEKGIKY